jgi:serine/threonine protein phosphatase 1
MIRRFFSNLATRPAPPPPPALPAGERVYAIGDIHGRLDLFDRLVASIEADDAARGPAATTIVLLGDLIDRGPESAGVIDSARALAKRRKVRALAGNHEEMFLKSFDKLDVLRHFLRFGGRETLLSYPISHALYEQMSLEELQAYLPNLVPAEHLDFLADMEDCIAIGDYLFVHAGIRPGVAVADQKLADLRWIRETFLDDPRDHGSVVVHGHTICDEVEERPNRIGIDTGAFMSGRLTALGLEGTSRWYLTASEANPPPN